MIFVDANVFMYAAGKESAQKQPCLRFLGRLVDRQEDSCTDTEVLQEILHRYCRTGDPGLGFELFDFILALEIRILPVTETAVCESRRLLAAMPGLSVRDCVHLGVMKDHGYSRILSYDRGFSRVPWVQRLEPE